MAETAAEQPVRLVIGKAELWRLSWPVAMENLLNMSLIWVDSIIINHKLGTESFAAIQMSGQILNIITLIMAVVATGASIVIAHQVGARQREEAGQTASQSIGLGVLVSLALGALVYVAAPLLLRVLGAQAGVLSLGVVFMRTIAAFMPAMAMLAIFGAILRAGGDTRGPMVVTLLVNILNAGLNYLFVYGTPAVAIAGLSIPALGGGMGLFGSATGTSLARVVGALLMLWMLLRRSEVPIRLARAFKFRAETVMRVARLGLPGAAEFISYQGSQFAMTMIIATLGTAVVAARGIANQTEAFTYVPAGAAAMAASILVGQLMGAKQRDDAVAMGRRAIIWGAGLMFSLAMVLFAFPRPIAGVFTQDPAVLDVAVSALRISSLYKAGQAVNIICGGIFRGAGNPQWPTMLTTIGTWSITVPLAFLLVRLGYGLPGVVFAQFLDEMIRGGINLWYFSTPRWRFRKV